MGIESGDPKKVPIQQFNDVGLSSIDFQAAWDSCHLFEGALDRTETERRDLPWREACRVWEGRGALASRLTSYTPPYHPFPLR